jgi:hypothetical protein
MYERKNGVSENHEATETISEQKSQQENFYSLEKVQEEDGEYVSL